MTVETPPGSSAAQTGFVPNLQLLRFVAALLVVTEHLQFKTRNLGFMAQGWLVDFKPIFLPIGIDIFFVVSGFIMFHLSRDRFGEPGYWRTFLHRRLIRIVPLYWLFTILIVAASFKLGDHMSHAGFSPAQVVASFAFFPWPRSDGYIVPVLSGGWTLNYEMLFYAIFAVALMFPRRRGLAVVAVVIVGLAVSHWLVPAGWWPLTFWTSQIILDFLLGIGLAGLYATGLRLSAVSGAVLLVAAIAALVVSKQFDAPAQIGRFLALGLPAAMVCAAFVLVPPPGRQGPLYRAMLAGGDASYSLYLSHGFTLALFAIACQRLDMRNPCLFFAGGVTVSVLIAWFIYTQFETRMLARLRGGPRRVRQVAMP